MGSAVHLRERCRETFNPVKAGLTNNSSWRYEGNERKMRVGENRPNETSMARALSERIAMMRRIVDLR